MQCWPGSKATFSWHVVKDTRTRKRRYPNDRKIAHHRDTLPTFPSQGHTASPMKPPHGFSMRGRPGPGDDDNGDYMSLLELGHEQDMMDIPDNMLAQPSQPDKKVDADFFNSFPDDFDEDDMRPVK